MGGDVENSRLMFQGGKQEELFRWLIAMPGFTRRSLSARLGIPKSTFRSYCNGKHLLKNSTFEKVVSLCPEAKQFESSIVKKLPLNWGRGKAGLLHRVKSKTRLLILQK
ncbi:MAG: hypothetical protein HY544_02620 [Candidatus Diapherotrites archaeon]|uniref:Uncharacterized protein n=1 Tax=Candidatus Iainarchaeum sp. TaxID=3101447 RepID=A0A8T3YK27_9ARCH|nr:hypothetical protein [Candidatus Diapherotrites archaeon]